MMNSNELSRSIAHEYKSSIADNFPVEGKRVSSADLHSVACYEMG